MTAVEETTEVQTPLTELVAQRIKVTGFIGFARHILEEAGHLVVLVGNRITVDDEVVAQLVGGEHPRWVVYFISGATPTWVVGAEVIL